MSAIVKRYVTYIKTGTINAATGAPWTIEDVPARWRESVRAEIEEGA